MLPGEAVRYGEDNEANVDADTSMVYDAAGALGNRRVMFKKENASTWSIREEEKKIN